MMAKRCPECKNEISRYQEFCYNCGAEIKHAAKRPKNNWNIIWKYFFLGMLIPPLGFGWFFFFSRDHYDESLSAFKGAIVMSILSFIFYRVMYWIIPFQPEEEVTTGIITVLKGFLGF